MTTKRNKLFLALLAVVALGVVLRVQFKTERHAVTLTWHAPPPKQGVTVVGYNVYRRTGEGGDFVRIAEKVPGLLYKDLLVNSGRTYFYAVTAVDQIGRESRFSTEIRTEIP